MKTVLILTLLLFYVPFNGFGQKAIEIPNNKVDIANFEYIQNRLGYLSLRDLTRSNDPLVIRIWMGHHIFEINGSDSLSSTVIIQINNTENDYKSIHKKYQFDSHQTKKMLDSIIKYDVFNLPDNEHSGLHGLNNVFEISTSTSYRFYSYWSPGSSSDLNEQKASQILKQIYTLLSISSLDSLFFNDLSPGNYAWGMSTVHVDRFCDENKKVSTLYRYVEQRLRNEFGLNERTNSIDFPSIFINDKESYMCDLNDYEYSQIKEITIHAEGAKASALYGIKGKSGVISIELKPAKRSNRNGRLQN